MCPDDAAAAKELTFTEAARRAQIVQAAIDTIAEVGYARASLSRIGARIGISKGLIGYHFAGKDDLIKQVVDEIREQGRAFIRPRVVAQASTGSGFLRAYIESNLAFLGEHRSYTVAIVEIALGVIADGQERLFGDIAGEDAHVLQQHLARFQSEGQLRADFDPRVMAVAIRAVLDAVPRRLADDPDLDVDTYASEIANLFDLATRLEQQL